MTESSKYDLFLMLKDDNGPLEESNVHVIIVNSERADDFAHFTTIQKLTRVRMKKDAEGSLRQYVDDQVTTYLNFLKALSKEFGWNSFKDTKYSIERF